MFLFRMFDEFVIERNPNITSNDLQKAKDQHYAKWVKDFVSFA